MGGWQQKKPRDFIKSVVVSGSKISGPGFYQTVRGVGSVFRLGSEVKAGSASGGSLNPCWGNLS